MTSLLAGPTERSGDLLGGLRFPHETFEVDPACESVRGRLDGLLRAEDRGVRLRRFRVGPEVEGDREVHPGAGTGLAGEDIRLERIQAGADGVRVNRAQTLGRHSVS